jgi:hypothetical protein
MNRVVLHQQPRDLRRLWPPGAFGLEPARGQLGADLAQAACVQARPPGARLGKRRHAPALAGRRPIAIARGLELGD